MCGAAAPRTMPPMTTTTPHISDREYQLPTVIENRDPRLGRRPSIRRRALLGGAAAACALAVLPNAAQAADVSIGSVIGSSTKDVLRVVDRDGQNNRVRLSIQSANTVFVADDRAIRTGAGCTALSPTQAQCTSPIPLRVVALGLGDGGDVASVPGGGNLPVFYDGGNGADTYLGGLSPARSLVRFTGGSGTDRADYAQSTAGVDVNKAGDARDGRKGLDNDSIGPDVEHLIGSRFDDTLVGSDDNALVETFTGGPGNDTMNGLRGVDIFEMGSVPDGADTISGGGADGQGVVDYSQRRGGVTVLQDNVAQDGEAGEGDNVNSMHLITGTNFRDTIGMGGRIAGTTFGIQVDARGDDDILVGTASDDNLTGGPGNDTYNAQGGNDSISANDGVAGENIDCGAGVDSLFRDSTDTRANCETDRVGILSLKTGGAKVGVAKSMRLTWTHPRGWKQLERVTLTIRDDRGASVGSLAIDARRGKLATVPADLRLKSGKLVREGKRVSARVTIRPTAALAGQTLTAAVEAVERSGARQVETKAGTIRVRG
jgi:RTX calcium-binding nonapeptide repeat (4 copies)